MEGEPPKLYLCTRDIKVGDKVKHPDPYNNDKLEDFEITKVPNDYNFIEGINKDVNNGNFIYLPRAFKIIDEISPEAIWVKDGDQFKDYQLWWWAIEHDAPFMKFVEGDKFEEKYPGKFKLVIKVKCHCCETYK